MRNVNGAAERIWVCHLFSGTGFQPAKTTGWKPVPLRLPREESRSVWLVVAMECGIPLVGPAFQPVKTTAWKEPVLGLSKGCPTTRQLRRAGMTRRKTPSKSMISSTNFKLATLEH